MDKKRIDEIKEKAFEIRCLTINEIASFGSGHIGGAMSISDLLALLYFDVMNVDPKNPGKEDRDRLVVSKGHAGPAVYASLALKGYFPKEMLSTLNQGGTSLPSHCDMLKTPGVDFTAGSLGQGFSAAAGIACGNRVKGVDAWTFSIIGDGESQEHPRRRVHWHGRSGYRPADSRRDHRDPRGRRSSEACRSRRHGPGA